MRVRRRPLLTLNSSEQAALYRQPNQKAPTGLRNLCILMLMLKTGLRSGEIINLMEEDIDWKEGKITLPESGAAKKRTLWLDEELLGLLKRWRSIKAAGRRYFFTTLKGNRLHDRYLREMVKRLARKAGIKKDVHPHLLRSTFASNLLLDSNDITLVQKALGHRDISTTRAFAALLFRDSDMVKYGNSGSRRSGHPAEPGAVRPAPSAGSAPAPDKELIKLDTAVREQPGRRPEEGAEKEQPGVRADRGVKYIQEELTARITQKQISGHVEQARKDRDLSAGPVSDRAGDSLNSLSQRTGEGVEKQKNLVTGRQEEEGGRPAEISTGGEPGERADSKMPIPPIKCSQCPYILRFYEDCPNCKTSITATLRHWGKSIT